MLWPHTKIFVVIDRQIINRNTATGCVGLEKPSRKQRIFTKLFAYNKWLYYWRSIIDTSVRKLSKMHSMKM